MLQGLFLNTFITKVIWLTCGLVFLLIMGLNIGGPILDIHSFRQTQTAITVYWFLQDGITIPHQIPLFGHPWAVPFEFPIYQYLVYAIARLTSIENLELLGRMVNIILFTCCLYPFRILLREVGLDSQQLGLATLAFLVTPVYLFWARTFMIETTALFLSLMFTASYFEYLRNSYWLTRRLGWVLLFAVLAGLTKITTFATFVMFIGVYSIFYRNKWQLFTQQNIAAVIVVLASIVITYLWTSYADGIKAENLFAMRFTSDKLYAWNFGPISQRFDPAIYPRIWDHLVHNSSYLIFLLLLLPFILAIEKQHIKTAVVCLLTFILPVLLFFNLYYIHNYYWYSNSLFLIPPIVLAITGIIRKYPFPRAHEIAMLLILGVSIFSYHTGYYYEWQSKDYTKAVDYQIASLIKSKTAREDIILIYGRDWSATIPFYSQRKAIMVGKQFAVDEESVEFLQLLNKSGVQRIGALVFCKADENFVNTRLEKLGARYSEAFLLNGCFVLLDGNDEKPR